MTTRLAIAVVVAAVCACTRQDVVPPPKEFEFGARRVQVVVPSGWETLDQGRQKRFRKGESEIVLQDLGPSPSIPAGTAEVDGLLERGLVAVGHDQRRDVKSRREATIDGRDAIDIETWNRLDHSNVQRIVFVSDDGDLLVMYTERMAFEASLAAFDSIRNSLHFVSARR